MAACPACGANIQHGDLESGEVIPLETFVESTGDRRYRVVDTKVEPPGPFGRTRLLIEPVRADAPIGAFSDHRKDCPGYGNGQ